MASGGLTIVGLIPARMSSSRLPGKPLAPILGMSMIEHVYRRTAMCSALMNVYVATCDQIIYEVVEGFGGRAIMTSPGHERASDRVAEAAESVPGDIVVMVQGDEPLVNPEMIHRAIEPMLENPDVQCVNLVRRISAPEYYEDPNCIKVVMNCYKEALYYSREPIPTRRVLGIEQIALFNQVCIIPFRREMLRIFSKLEPTPLERAESIDMLRLLEHGYKIRLVETAFETRAVDTPEDLIEVEKLMRNDPLTPEYVDPQLGVSGL